MEANRKYGYSADETLKLIQNLYEKKLVTYPRVDTTYLTEDLHPKISGILQGLTYYKRFTEELLSKPIPKSKAVFDNKKVTDHHAIIPTGIVPSGITPQEQHIYDTIVKRFLAVFYPECKIFTTTVIGKVGQVEFKASGKQILDLGWRIIYAEDQVAKKETSTGSATFNSTDAEIEKVMPLFVEGEKGPHEPKVHQGKTAAPKFYTEATLLRGMETAGKQVEDEEMRELLKDNGIGRPSTRANIIETLFRRRYIERNKKNIFATQTGIDLIDTIQNDLLKSPELTGDWERKIRMIEKGEYSIEVFKTELIQMVVDLCNEVIFNSRRIISIAPEKVEVIKEEKVKKPRDVKPKEDINIEKMTCPKCKSNLLKKGNTAFGCSNFAVCGFKIPFELLGKKLTDKYVFELLSKGKTSKIKGLIIPGNSNPVDGKIVFTKDFNLEVEN